MKRIFVWISEPKRLGWWNFWIWVSFSLYTCYISQLAYSYEFGRFTFPSFIGLCVISGLLSFLITGVDSIQQRSIRMVFKLLVISAFISLIVWAEHAGVVRNFSLMLGGGHATLSGPTKLQYFSSIVQRVFSLLAPLFFVFAILLSGEWEKTPSKSETV